MLNQRKETLEKIFPDPEVRVFVENLIDALPKIVAILDDNRRLLYSNQALLDATAQLSFEEAFQLRPGELFSCANSKVEHEGCGASEACELCGAFRAMVDSRSLHKKVINECKIVSELPEGVKAHNFRFSSSPFIINGKFYYVVAVEDISSEKRREELERIFFHDILNSIASIKGTINLLKLKGKADPEHIDILEITYNHLFDSVIEQKEFTLAESGDLEVKTDIVSSRDILIESQLHFTENESFKAELQMDEESPDILFSTDESLLKRVIINMLKNALEASGKDDIVEFGAIDNEDSIRFYVKNPAYIPREIQLVIFERAFSTKGNGRGLGTFSMKLLGENYLGGKVSFSSTTKDGTTFWIDLPLKNQNPSRKT